jgi:hypothetical protein
MISRTILFLSRLGIAANDARVARSALRRRTMVRETEIFLNRYLARRPPTSPASNQRQAVAGVKTRR